MDSVVVLSTCQRTISFLMAESSYMKKIVGHIAWAMGVVPVKRAQDSAKKGIGAVLISKVAEKDQDENKNEKGISNGNHSGGFEQINGTDKNHDKEGNKSDDDDEKKPMTSQYTIHGTNTEFTQQIKPKDKIRFPHCPNGLKIISIKSDTVMIGVGNSSEFGEEQQQKVLSSTTPFDYEILKHIEQSEVYEKVLAKLASSGAIGIFPEGGSHDRTDLLPLKAGVALIAYSALEKDGLSVPIVPVGLNYFQRHKIRGRVTVEYGKPIFIDPSTLGDFTRGGDSKRRVCNEVLERLVKTKSFVFSFGIMIAMMNGIGSKY